MVVIPRTPSKKMFLCGDYWVYSRSRERARREIEEYET